MTEVVAIVETEDHVISVGSQQVIEVGYSQPGGTVGDKFFQQAFNSVTTVSVAHNLQKFPAVAVADTAGAQCMVDVTYIDNRNLTVRFNHVMSGTIYCS